MPKTRWIPASITAATLLAAATTVTHAGFDACSLIPNATIESVQGEPVVSTKGTERETGGITIAQCYYALPTHNRSVSVEVATPGSDPAKMALPRQLFRQLFRNQKEKSRSATGQARKINGVGDEAYWSGNSHVGALYVLEGDGYVRVSVGGSHDQATRVERSKALAKAAVERMPRARKRQTEIARSEEGGR